MSLALKDTLTDSTSGTLPEGSGCHLLVLNPYTRRPTLQLYFNTNDYLIDIELVQTLKNLRKGHLALLTTFYEASGRLQPPSRVALRSLGSWAAPHLKFHDSWVWAWRVGGSTVGEALVSSPQSILDPLSPGHLHLEVDLHVNSSALGRFCRDWPQDDLWEKRSYFCDLYDGYGDLCSCDDPFLPDNAPPRMDTWREDIAVVILAGSRPRYLYRLLGQLLTQPGMTSDLVLVSVDGEDEETIRLLEVLELRFFLHVPEGSFSSTKISRHLRFALFRALRTLPEIEKFVLLEDDLLLAPDFYSYMQQTSQILHTDPSVLAVSSYSIFGAPHTARDLSRLNRVTSLPACGWMRTAWDYWFWTDMVRQGRDIIVPEVPRTAHAGRYGTHASGLAAMTRDARKPISTDPSARVDILANPSRTGPIRKEVPASAVGVRLGVGNDRPSSVQHLSRRRRRVSVIYELQGRESQSVTSILWSLQAVWKVQKEAYEKDLLKELSQAVFLSLENPLTLPDRLSRLQIFFFCAFVPSLALLIPSSVSLPISFLSVFLFLSSYDFFPCLFPLSFFLFASSMFLLSSHFSLPIYSFIHPLSFFFSCLSSSLMKEVLRLSFSLFSLFPPHFPTFIPLLFLFLHLFLSSHFSFFLSFSIFSSLPSFLRIFFLLSFSIFSSLPSFLPILFLSLFRHFFPSPSSPLSSHSLSFSLSPSLLPPLFPSFFLFSFFISFYISSPLPLPPFLPILFRHLFSFLPFPLSSHSLSPSRLLPLFPSFSPFSFFLSFSFSFLPFPLSSYSLSFSFSIFPPPSLALSFPLPPLLFLNLFLYLFAFPSSHSLPSLSFPPSFLFSFSISQSPLSPIHFHKNLGER
ncbi:Protein O-linked-mannose beta-1,2-N-acetylglucosaminyltransferase 1 [Penaeus vannamei]|uniref:Protein O-linked-mannose beta-1,2-N-acetylglucosaminyltransferase 1 n=1 Tax=Penaeus vannamei TaxID=6689 RepID=A0A423TYI4_PENVA|nr:Protein O-linked-mannose beta-1,2-N-acetylglucosaminyltransferase 1 [Penaeus vannamei]